jgi:hypothetical protein
MDMYVIYGSSSLPLEPSECDLLKKLLNKRFELGNAQSTPESHAAPDIVSTSAGATGIVFVYYIRRYHCKIINMMIICPYTHTNTQLKTGPIISVTPALEHSPTGQLFARGWQVTHTS